MAHKVKPFLECEFAQKIPTPQKTNYTKALATPSEAKGGIAAKATSGVKRESVKLRIGTSAAQSR